MNISNLLNTKGMLGALVTIGALIYLGGAMLYPFDGMYLIETFPMRQDEVVQIRADPGLLREEGWYAELRKGWWLESGPVYLGPSPSLPIHLAIEPDWIKPNEEVVLDDPGDASRIYAYVDLRNHRIVNSAEPEVMERLKKRLNGGSFVRLEK